MQLGDDIGDDPLAVAFEHGLSVLVGQVGDLYELHR
jgi:hypothetical protein